MSIPWLGGRRTRGAAACLFNELRALQDVIKAAQGLFHAQDHHDVEDSGRNRGAAQRGTQRLGDLSQCDLFLVRHAAGGGLDGFGVPPPDRGQAPAQPAQTPARLGGWSGCQFLGLAAAGPGARRPACLTS